MQEKRAVLLLLGLAVAGQGARLLFHRSQGPPGQLLATATPNDLIASHRARAARIGKPLRPGETVDVNTAPPEEIARLPGVGMSLAKRIVARRNDSGPYHALADMDRVPGVGPAMLERIADWVGFGGVRGVRPRPSVQDVSGATTSGYEDKTRQTDLNSATLADLVALPGIGGVRARAVLAYRREKGPFAAVSDLRGVPGFSQALIKRLEPLVRVR